MGGEIPEEEQGMRDPSMHSEERVDTQARGVGASGKRSPEESMAILSADGEASKEKMKEILRGDLPHEQMVASSTTEEAKKVDPVVPVEKPQATKVKTIPDQPKQDNETESISPVDVPEIPTEYDGSGKKVDWPGKDKWGANDAAHRMTDAQLAADYAFKYVTAKERPGNPQIKDHAAEYIDNYEKIMLAEGEGAKLVQKCVASLLEARKKGDNRTFAAISRDLTDERGALKE